MPIETWHDPLHRFATSLSGDREEARKLTRQTFARWSQCGRESEEPTADGSRLFAILYREFLKARGLSGNGSNATTDDDGLDDFPSTREFAKSAVRCQEVLAALQTIDPASRASLALFYLGKHSFSKIAGILGVPAQTVVSRIAQGRKELHRRLGTTTTDPAAGS